MKILFITTSLYPEENAMAQRVHLFAKMCSEIGHDVYILSNGKTGYLEEKLYDGIRYKSLKVNGKNILIRYLGLKFYWVRLEKALRKIDKPDVIFVSDMYNNALTLIKKYCKDNSVKLISDCVEWFSPEEYKNGEKNKEYKDNIVQNTKLLDTSVNVVSISRYLYDYFSSKGINTVRIPVLCDSACQTENREKNERVSFVYAGNPGLKDNLGVIFQAVQQLPAGIRSKCIFNFIGIDYTFMNQYSGVSDICVCHGRKSHEETVAILKKCDFSFLFRNPDAVYAKAGFPSKSVESVNYGIPIIMNYSSDLELYFQDKLNCLLVEPLSAERILNAISTAASLSRFDITRMQVEAKTTAEKEFDYHLFMNAFNDFLNNLV